MATRKNLNTSMIAGMTGVFSQVVITGTLYLSGMPGIDPVSGKIRCNDRDVYCVNMQN